MVKVIASVLNADFSKKKEWLPQLNESEIDGIQWDIMDNKYVPNTGIEKQLIGELRPQTKLFFESHLMVVDPENYLEEMAELGTQLLTFHIETTNNPKNIIKEINDFGMSAGIAINNKTPAEKIFPHLDKVDLSLVMSVEAGFGGQKFNPLALEKISLLRKKIDEEAIACEIEVDGGIKFETAKECVKAGADILVSGTGIFKHQKGIKEAIKEMKEL